MKIILLSSFSLLVLFILTKFMGNREMSQLSMFDYVIGITIGSIAAEMATSLENSFLEPLTAMIVYAVLTILISFISSHSIKARNIIAGKALILFDNGRLFKNNFKKSKLDLNEFLTQCRINGYFNLNDIQTAILESNGRISFLPKNLKRPITPKDLNLNPPIDNIVTTLILDGIILEENLKSIGYNYEWLKKELKKQNIKKENDIFLATYDNQDNLSVYKKLNQTSPKNLLE